MNINALEIDYLPVGLESRSGDAIALRFGYCENEIWKKQTIFIIDGGDLNSGQALVDHVKNVYQSNIVDRVILTHPDGDHASGLRKVIEQLHIGKIWMHRPWNHWSDLKDSIVDGRITKKSFGKTLKEAYQYAYEVEQYAKEKKIEIFAPHQGSYYHEWNNPAPLLTIMGPSKELYLDLIRASEKTPEMTVQESIVKTFTQEKKTAYEDMSFETEHLQEEDGETSSENNMSLVLYLNVGGYTSLFTADAGTMGLYNSLRFAVEKGINLKTLNLLHVPHHGSRHNISKGILNSLGAKSAIISCAKNGAPHHPSEILTNALIRRHITPYATQGKLLNNRYGNAPLRKGFGPAKSVDFCGYVEIS